MPMATINIQLPATVSVPANASIGTVLARASNSVPAPAYLYSCRSNGMATTLTVTLASSMTRFTSLSSVSGVYNTNIPGIGIQITSTAGIPSPVPTSNSYTNSYGSDVTQFNGTLNGGANATASLVVTGTVGAGGSITNGQVGNFKVGILSGSYNQSPIVVAVNLTGTTTIAPVAQPTCAVDAASSQTVNLGNYPSSAFTGTGSMTPPKEFNINFNCSGGTSGQSRTVYLTMTDATVPSNRTDILNLATSSTAKGVGIRLYRDAGATAVKFGADSATVGNTNQWTAGTVSTGTSSLTVPLQARLIQTGPVQQGSVSAKATFTAAYN
jgi:type 1 fimbria pilin